MDEIRRHLILKIADGDMRAFSLIHPLEKFKLRMHMYQWLLKNKITGKKFYEFCEGFEFKWAYYGNHIRKKIIHEQKSTLTGGDLL
jgi:hypothetical protein